MLLLIFGIWLTIISGRLTVLGKSYAECYGIEKFHTFVASKKSCARYIFCDGENSFEGECLGDNAFNEREGNCDDPKEVECHALSNGSVNSDNDKHNGNGYNENNVNTSVSNSELLNSNVNSGIIISNYGNEEYKPIIDSNQPVLSMPPDLNGFPSGFNPKPTGHPANEFVEKPQCPQNNDQTNFIHLPNPASCASYYTCYNGIAIPMICGRNMYFNEQRGKCEPQEQVHCALERPVNLQCLKGIYDFMPHPRNCDYYYFCSNGFLLIFQCPFKFTWHYERRTCVHQSQSKCFSTSILQKMLLA